MKCPTCQHEAHDSRACLGTDGVECTCLAHAPHLGLTYAPESKRCPLGCTEEMSAEEQALRHRVGVMRELGVEEWDGIVLGPPPRAPREDATLKEPLTPEQAAREKKRAKYRRELGRDDLSDEFLDSLP